MPSDKIDVRNPVINIRFPKTSFAEIERCRPELLATEGGSAMYAVQALVHEALGIAPPPTPSQRKAEAGRKGSPTGQRRRLPGVTKSAAGQQ